MTGVLTYITLPLAMSNCSSFAVISVLLSLNPKSRRDGAFLFMFFCLLLPSGYWLSGFKSVTLKFVSLNLFFFYLSNPEMLLVLILLLLGLEELYSFSLGRL